MNKYLCHLWHQSDYRINAAGRENINFTKAIFRQSDRETWRRHCLYRTTKFTGQAPVSNGVISDAVMNFTMNHRGMAITIGKPKSMTWLQLPRSEPSQSKRQWRTSASDDSLTTK